MIYKLKFYLQVFLWLLGNPVHLNNECVIDFSCCFNIEKKCFSKRLNMVINRIIYRYWKKYPDL
jgi:hypothetical protein